MCLRANQAPGSNKSIKNKTKTLKKHKQIIKYKKTTEEKHNAHAQTQKQTKKTRNDVSNLCLFCVNFGRVYFVYFVAKTLVFTTKNGFSTADVHV